LRTSGIEIVGGFPNEIFVITPSVTQKLALLSSHSALPSISTYRRQSQRTPTGSGVLALGMALIFSIGHSEE